METDEILTGKAKKQLHEDPIADAFYWHRTKPLTKEELESFQSREASIPTSNPKPIIEMCDGPNGKRNKSGKGILLGLEWSF